MHRKPEQLAWRPGSFPVPFLVRGGRERHAVTRHGDKLSAGGSKGRCGWLKDKFGLSWQIVAQQGSYPQAAAWRINTVTGDTQFCTSAGTWRCFRMADHRPTLSRSQAA